MDFEVAFFTAAAGCLVVAAALLLIFVLYQRERSRSLHLNERRNRDEIFFTNLGGAVVEARRAMDSHGTNRQQATSEMERYLTNMWHDERRQRHRHEDGPPYVAEALRSIVRFCTSVKLPAPEELSQQE